MGNSFIIFLPFICFPSNTKISQLLQTQNFALSWFEIKVFLFFMTRNWETVGPTGWQTRTRAQIRKLHQSRTKIFKFPFKKKKVGKTWAEGRNSNLVRTKKLAGIQKHIVISISFIFFFLHLLYLLSTVFDFGNWKNSFFFFVRMEMNFQHFQGTHATHLR